MGAIISILSVVIKTIFSLIQQLPTLISKGQSVVKIPNAAKNGGVAASRFELQYEITAATTLYNFAYSLIYVLIAIIFMFIVPLCLKVITRAMRGIGIIARGWERSLDLNARDKWYYKLFIIVFKIIPFIIYKFIEHIVFGIARNIVTFITLLAVIFLFIFAFERHLNQTVELFSDASDLGVIGVNVLGSILQIMIDVKEFLLPITNMVIRYAVVVMMHIFDGISYTIDNFSGRRLNSIGSDAFVDTVTHLIQICQTIYNLQLTVVTTVIDVFFHTGLIRALEAFTTIISVAATKFVCLIAGQECSIREFYDFLVFDILFSFFELFCFGLCHIPRAHNIACPTARLTQLGVGSECKGFFTSFEPPGIFRNALSKETRRQLIECTIVDDGNMSSLSNDFCHMSAAAFTSHGHAQNMFALDTHDCYKICVDGVFLEACEDRVYLLGLKECRTASKKINKIGFTRAQRKVRNILNNKNIGLARKLQGTTESDSSLSRGEIIERLRARFGSLVFRTSHGICDLTHSQTSIFDSIVDGACFLSKNIQLDDIDVLRGRHLDEQPTKPIFDALSSLRHSRRLFVTSILETHSTLPAHLRDNNFVHLQRALLTKPTFKPKRISRKLETVCEPNELLCPNDHQCVTNYDECDATEKLNFMGLIRFYFTSIGSIVNISPIDLLYKEWQCWRFIIFEDRSADPYFGANILADQADLNVRTRYCLPMMRPMTITIPKLKFSLKKYIYDGCIAVSSNFTSCSCPMFYILPSTSLPYWDFLSYDLVFILLNGIIWLKNVFVFVVGNIPGYIWASIFSTPTFPREISHAFVLYSSEITIRAYWLCQGFHLGSAGLLIFTIICIYFTFKYVYEVVWYIITSLNYLKPQPEIQNDLEAHIE